MSAPPPGQVQINADTTADTTTDTTTGNATEEKNLYGKIGSGPLNAFSNVKPYGGNGRGPNNYKRIDYTSVRSFAQSRFKTAPVAGMQLFQPLKTAQFTYTERPVGSSIRDDLLKDPIKSSSTINHNKPIPLPIEKRKQITTKDVIGSFFLGKKPLFNPVKPSYNTRQPQKEFSHENPALFAKKEINIFGIHDPRHLTPQEFSQHFKKPYYVMGVPLVQSSKKPIITSNEDVKQEVQQLKAENKQTKLTTQVKYDNGGKFVDYTTGDYTGDDIVEVDFTQIEDPEFKALYDKSDENDKKQITDLTTSLNTISTVYKYHPIEHATHLQEYDEKFEELLKEASLDNHLKESAEELKSINIRILELEEQLKKATTEEDKKDIIKELKETQIEYEAQKASYSPEKNKLAQLTINHLKTKSKALRKYFINIQKQVDAAVSSGDSSKLTDLSNYIEPDFYAKLKSAYDTTAYTTPDHSAHDQSSFTELKEKLESVSQTYENTIKKINKTVADLEQSIKDGEDVKNNTELLAQQKYINKYLIARLTNEFKAETKYIQDLLPSKKDDAIGLIKGDLIPASMQAEIDDAKTKPDKIKILRTYEEKLKTALADKQYSKKIKEVSSDDKDFKENTKKIENELNEKLSDIQAQLEALYDPSEIFTSGKKGELGKNYFAQNFKLFVAAAVKTQFTTDTKITTQELNDYTKYIYDKAELTKNGTYGKLKSASETFIKIADYSEFIEKLGKYITDTYKYEDFNSEKIVAEKTAELKTLANNPDDINDTNLHSYINLSPELLKNIIVDYVGDKGNTSKVYDKLLKMYIYNKIQTQHTLSLQQLKELNYTEILKDIKPTVFSKLGTSKSERETRVRAMFLGFNFDKYEVEDNELDNLF